MNTKAFGLALVVLFSTTTLAIAGDRSFKIEPGSVLSPSYRRPPPRHVEPRPVYISPPLTAFDRNMVPAANATPASVDYDLSERISFGKPKR